MIFSKKNRYIPITKSNLVNTYHLRSAITLSLGSSLVAAHYAIDIQFELLPSLLPLFLLLSLNSIYYALLPIFRDIHYHTLSAQILVDITLLSISFYFSGGPSNPFISFYLVPLTISATLLRPSFTWFTTALTFACYTGLLVYAPQPEQLHMMPHHGPEPAFNVHLIGMWLNFCFSAALITFFITRLNQEIAHRDASLEAYREKIVQGEQVLGVATLAAGVAHEIGTPLSTIAVAVNDMLEEDISPEVTHDLELIDSQLKECKGILRQLTVDTDQQQDNNRRPPKTASEYLHHLLDRLAILRPQCTALLASTPMAESRTHSHLITPPLIVDQALINLINNAFDASPDEVTIQYGIHEDTIEIRISDKGKGIDEQVLEHLGKPFISKNKEDGLGLGLFLAHATLDRLGGSLSIHKNPIKGTLSRVTIPLHSIS